MLTNSNDSTAIADALVFAEAFGIEQIVASPEIVPRQKGLYSWWMTPGSVPGLSGTNHPHRPALQLLYVGIASKPTSDLHQRLTTHIGGTSRRSTQRLSLAALLAEEYSWNAAMVSGRPALAPEFESQLGSFMAQHLRVSWFSRRPQISRRFRHQKTYAPSQPRRQLEPPCVFIREGEASRFPIKGLLVLRRAE